MRLGVLGGGGIATTVLRATQNGSLPGVEVVAIAGRTTPPSQRIRDAATLARCAAVSVDQLLASDIDWILEAAGVDAARTHIPDFLVRGRNAVIMSVGAMLDETLEHAVRRRRQVGGRVELPSGAIAGLDAVRSMNALGGLRSATIVTTKAPRGLAGAPYLSENGIQLSATTAHTIFKGTAREAIRGFPANANVTISLSLAGLGPDRTMVELVSDPNAKSTQHRIILGGDAGQIEIVVAARPHPDNPKTSYLAALSAVQALKSQAVVQ